MLIMLIRASAPPMLTTSRGLTFLTIDRETALILLEGITRFIFGFPLCVKSN